MSLMGSLIAPADGYESKEGLYPIRIVDGEFNGVVARIGNFREDANGQLYFDVEILEGKVDADKNDAFEQLMNDFIREAVEEAVRQKKEQE